MSKSISAHVYHAEIWGLREQKRDWLQAHDVSTTNWQEISPKSPFYLFVPRDEAALDRYNGLVSVTDIFPVHSVGIVTSRDRFVIDFDREALKRRIRQFRDPNVPDELLRTTFKLKDKANWKLAEARRKVQQDDNWEQKIVPCLYRPFDRRWIFYHPAAIERGREDVMRHMLAGENVALMTCRQLVAPPWAHAMPTATLTDDCMVSNRTRERGYIFPMYLNPDPEKDGDLFGNGRARHANLSPDLIAALAQAYGTEPAPEGIFHYVYAVLYAPAYREKYAEFLRIDFPRIPFTADRELFEQLAALGERLVALHLLKSPELDPPAARFEGQGDNRVACAGKKGLRYEPEQERVCINATQYFAPVPPELWQYRIGGYQVLQKWLKDRRERRLTLDEIRTYCRVVTAIGKTIAIQQDIDALYPAAESSVIEVPQGT